MPFNRSLDATGNIAEPVPSVAVQRGRTTLYHQVKEYIASHILPHHDPEQPIPSEAQLCQLLRVSRITVRQAIAELASEGRVKRIQGRGTFIAAARIEKQLTHFLGFAEEMDRRHKRAE